MFRRIRKNGRTLVRRSLAFTGVALLGFMCGCQSGSGGFKNPFRSGSRVTVLLGARTLDPNVPLTPISIRSTRDSEDCKRGLDYFGRGDYVRAADAFDRASKINPSDHNSVYLAGLAYEKLGDQDAACSRYVRAARIEYRSEYLDGESRACDRNDRG